MKIAFERKLDFPWGGGRVVMALCLGTFFFQSAVRKSAGSIPALLNTHANEFFWLFCSSLAPCMALGFWFSCGMWWEVGGWLKDQFGGELQCFMKWERCMDERMCVGNGVIVGCLFGQMIHIV